MDCSRSTDVPRELSEEKLADFLVLNHADHVTTIYRNVFRVPPAHVMQVEVDGSISSAVTGRRPRSSRSDLLPIGPTPKDCARRLDQAVRRQMRSAHPIGCLLSGGLDSSSVSALAARALAEKNQRLVAFTGVPRRGFDGPVPGWLTTPTKPLTSTRSRSTSAISTSTYVRNEECDDFAELERFFVALEGPVRNPTNFGWMLAILRRARTQGRRVLLGGLYGNSTISWNGWSQAVTHLQRGRLFTAYRQWQHFYRSTPYSRWVALRKLFARTDGAGTTG